MKKIILIFAFLLVYLSAFGNEELKKQLNYAINICQQDMQQFTASGLTLPQYLNFCKCYMTEMTNAVDEKEMKYQKKYRKPSGKFIKTSKKIRKKCESKFK